MEASGTGIGRLDCYEDMFKEITRKLYGEDPDHRTSSVQNEFETSVSYKNDEDTGNGTDGSDEGNWTCEEEPLKGTDGSRIAAYHAGKATWRCYECGDIMGGGPRETAEHFMELHSRILPDDSRNRHHSPRKDYLQDLKIEDVVSYLERLRERAERAAPPTRRTQETQTVPAALLPVASTFLLQELPSAPVPQHLHQNAPTLTTSATTSGSTKRYSCSCCPYATDRRDLFSRHENIHREEKPFECYICRKPFNRADHVKKHFLRMHREHQYDISRIRRPVGTSAPKPLQQDSGATQAANVVTGQQPQQQQQHANYQAGFASNKNYQLQPNTSSATVAAAGTTGIYQAPTMPAPGIMQPDANNCATGRRVQNGGCNSKSHLKGGSKSTQERRYNCCYCSWSGVDNWCLKRHLNTHLKPFACALCEYKAARSERLSTHVLKVHNRRQCSRCSFLAEDAAQLQMHQLHVHRVSNANAPATSTTQAAPPPSNRHQQPLHPAGGGRPPPGPPVFPAPAPAIAPATTVIPPTTILGHEMVKSPATAATMAYPTEEENRSYCHFGVNGDDDNNDGDNDGVVRGNGNREERSDLARTRDLDAYRACSFKSDRDDNLLSCSDHYNGNRNDATEMTTNNNFTCSIQLPRVNFLPNISPPILEEIVNVQNNQPRINRRKQSQPRRVVDINSLGTSIDLSIEPRKKLKYIVKVKETIYGRNVKRHGFVRCHLCPRNALARGRHQPYHTRVSLILHKLWRHKKRHGTYKTNLHARPNLSSPVSSITLKATLFTRSNYRIDYHR